MSAYQGLPRGIPAASLKLRIVGHHHDYRCRSSAGNTRGLIEADTWRHKCPARPASSAGNTRGLIEAWIDREYNYRLAVVFRGEYPRPH